MDFLREILHCGRSGVIVNVAERLELVCQWFLIGGPTDAVLRRGRERSDQRWREDKKCRTEKRGRVMSRHCGHETTGLRGVLIRLTTIRS